MSPWPAIRGGAIQTMIDGVVPFLRRRHEVTIFSITDPDLPEREERDGVRANGIGKGHAKQANGAPKVLQR